MKDIEKIKSEDLGCQVADANPANFAIEQEVAQLVGATVPAPTEPSADDARELGTQLLVFLRRALLPIRSALRTAVAAIYAHLDSRCTDYTPAAYDPFRLPAGPYDPMRPLTPRTLPNLLTALTAFSDRKIGGVPEAEDGISLVHLMTSSAAGGVTELTDDNNGYTMEGSITKLDYLLGTFLTNVVKMTIGCEIMNWSLPYARRYLLPQRTYTELSFPNLREIHTEGSEHTYCQHFNGLAALTSLSLPNLEWINGSLVYDCDELTELSLPNLQRVGTFVARDCDKLERIEAENLETCGEYTYYPTLIGSLPALKYASFPKLSSIQIYGDSQGAGTLQNMPELEELIIGKAPFTMTGQATYSLQNCPKLIKLVIYGDLNQNLYLNSWNPTDKGTTFLQNFREHIALRLTANGSGLTLTLSQAVFDTIWNADGTPKSTDPDSVIYQINKIIKTDKHWSVNRA